MSKKNNTLVKYACYTTNISMSVISTLSPLLFLTFRNLYDISFSMLGSLVLINFCTQLAVDLIFSFYSHKFNISKTIKFTPVLTALGLFVYAIFPYLFPDKVFLGLVIGTIIFSSSGGLVEVFISPVIAKLPTDNPEKEMSKLHSVYAWGVVGVVIFSTLFLTVFGKENWQWLAIVWLIIPLISASLFIKSTLPELQTLEKASNVFLLFKQKDFIVLLFCMFLGAASECTMAQWSSSYIEQALNIPKIYGDIFGVAMFAAMLGLGRTLYSKYGRNIYKILLLSALGASVCYIIATISTIPIIALIACAMTGLCTAMLWPGNLIVASEKFSSSGVAIFALMAASGDLGGAIGPQLVGSITDIAMTNKYIYNLSMVSNLTIEQLAMKAGLTAAIAFPLLASILNYKNYIKNKNKIKKITK